jgi:hypothetical protein
MTMKEAGMTMKKVGMTKKKAGMANRGLVHGVFKLHRAG